MEIDNDERLIYRRHAVPLGPFEEEPCGLQDLALSSRRGASSTARRPGEYAIAWLLAAVEAAGVELSDYDRVSVPLIFEDCGAPGLQVVAGWIARAKPPEREPRWMHDGRRATSTRLLDALDGADVALRSYDYAMTGFLIEDCGPPAARLIARWLCEVQPDEGYDNGGERPDPVIEPKRDPDPALDRAS